MYTYTSGGNKKMYIADKRSCYMLKLAAKFGSVSDLLYIFPNIVFTIFILPVVFTPDISLFLYKHMITIQISTPTLSALCLDFVLVDIFLNITRVLSKPEINRDNFYLPFKRVLSHAGLSVESDRPVKP